MQDVTWDHLGVNPHSCTAALLKKGKKAILAGGVEMFSTSQAVFELLR
jgi:hypothetical protein